MRLILISTPAGVSQQERAPIKSSWRFPFARIIYMLRRSLRSVLSPLGVAAAARAGSRNGRRIGVARLSTSTQTSTGAAGRATADEAGSSYYSAAARARANAALEGFALPQGVSRQGDIYTTPTRRSHTVCYVVHVHVHVHVCVHAAYAARIAPGGAAQVGLAGLGHALWWRRTVWMVCSNEYVVSLCV